MTALQWSTTAESVGGNEDRLFHRLRAFTLAVLLLVGVIIPQIVLPPPLETALDTPRRIVQIIAGVSAPFSRLQAPQAQQPRRQPAATPAAVPAPVEKTVATVSPAKSKPAAKPAPKPVAKAAPKPVIIEPVVKAKVEPVVKAKVERKIEIKSEPKTAFVTPPEVKPQPSAAPKVVVAPPAQVKPKPARKKVEQTGLLAFNATLAKLSQAQSQVAEPQASRSDTATSAESQLQAPSDALAAGVTTQNGLADATNLVALASLQQRLLTPQSTSLAGGGETGTGVGPQRVAGVSTVAGSSAANYDNAVRGRSEEQIQGVLNRHKNAIYQLYNRELATAPSLQGKMVVSVTIEPSGRVSLSRVIDSELGSISLESGLVRLISAIDFGAIPESARVTTRVPIDFFPQ